MIRLFILFFFSSLLFSQSVTGIVTDAETNKPISNVNITLKGTSMGTVTNMDGEFVIKGEFNNNDVFIFSHISYEVTEKSYGDIKTNGNIKLNVRDIRTIPVVVNASVGTKGETPVTFDEITREDIEGSYINQDVPELLSYLPSTTFYSEGGAGLGYNYINIRGFDQRRISVAINGIVQNEPEDHNVYWLDIPDIVSYSGMIQVQRGSGSGVFGYPAIGGTINIVTSPFSEKPEVSVGTQMGSYNTRKYIASFASGLIDGKYSVYARMSHTLSSGYRDQNWIDFKSYYLSAARYDENVTTQINIYGGPVADGLTYTGLPKFAIEDKDLRRENYNYWEASNGEYTYKTVRRPEELENFSQPHFEVLNDIKINKRVSVNSALFLIIGKGFFDYDGSWAGNDYFRFTMDNQYLNLQEPANGYMSNTLIRAQVENKQFGWIPKVTYNFDNGSEIVAGAELRFHRSVHWGGIRYAEGIPVGVPEGYRYYYYEGYKDIVNGFVHGNFVLSDKINVLAELQLAYHKYKIENERYLDNEFDIDDTFLNPRFGVNYKFNDELSSYLSFAMVTREPRLKSYYDAAESSGGEVPQFAVKADGSYDYGEPLVKPETMYDFELGVNYQTTQLELSANGFYMSFEDEMVKNGQLDRFGQPMVGNMDETVHTGIELTADYKVNEYIELIANGTYSANYIKNGKTYISEDEAVDLTDNEIAGFPEVIFNGIVKFSYRDLSAQFLAKYVGEYYSDNYSDNLSTLRSKYDGITSYDDNKVEAYFVANFHASYMFDANPVFNNVKVFAAVNNLFDKLYASYAIGGEFFPAAERNFMAGIEVGL